ncbi:hypothetical protein PUNSTDRAFT_102455 [Punctularia strigosozonata HHB-11173 SS5]|uniref:uncharacterized protein n=1 Tax=Punctularia strigosozonata (strain HHB-11173) TaxID=741275 RepID=UPI0004416866|nr:uncharacterized protein PUNSTDRAFT_102455 [Punctularia strigosozonata HHB-11173 SS5]EIN08927.1 hypothetical protein PUNSTDRAFT_102455 [Punctularia strigosozonata HHB-11173 SS5]
MTRATSTQSAGGVVAAVHAHHHQPATATPSQPQRQSLRLRTAAEEVFRNLGPSRSIPCPGQTGRQEQEQVRARASVPPSATSTTSPQATVGVEAGGSGGVAGAAAASSLRRFVIRTDVHFDEGAGLMTAMLELPGIKKSDLSLVISTCPYTRVRQLTVAGRNQSVWPEGSLGWTVRERKFGTFSRMIVVPPETRADTVAAEMRDGILTLRIPIGQPMPRERPTAIPIA